MKPSDFCDQVVLPALYERLDSAFPEFGWKRRGDGWAASTWPSDFPFRVDHENADRLMVYADRPWRIKVHGHDGVPLVAYVNGGRSPTGADYWTAVRELARRAGVDASPIERAPTEEETKAARERQARGDALAAVIEYGTDTLWSAEGADARAFLASRGFTEDEIRSLGLGYYRSVSDAGKRLRAAGVDRETASNAGLEWPKLEGYVLVPWHDAFGQPLTLYGRWSAKVPPDGTPKTIALPGEGTKRDALYLDRARKAGHRELVVVEGVFDAAMLQARGDTRVVASVAARLNGAQLDSLVRHRIQTVYICGDPDGGGIRGNVANVRELEKRGIRTFVVERLPDGLDPDEFVLREGVQAWRERVSLSEPGRSHQTRDALGSVAPESPTTLRRAHALAAVKLVDTFDPLDREDALKLVAEKTGYSFESLAELVEEAEASSSGDDAVAEPEKEPTETGSGETQAVPGLRDIGATLDEALRRARARLEGIEKPIPLPWPDMVAQFGGGLWPGLHVLVGGTGSGKTTCAMQMALSAARAGFPVGYIGLELDEMQIALRLLAEQSGVSWSGLYLGKSRAALDKAEGAKSAIASLPLYVEQGRPSGWPVNELEGFAKRMRIAHPETTPGSQPMLLVLDFLQIVGDEVNEGKAARLDVRERIGRAAYFARDIARRYNVATLLISSAGRDKYTLLESAAKTAGLAEKKGRRIVYQPDVLIGLGKESGEIEYAADSVTVAIASPRLKSLEGTERAVIFVTAKGRATGAGWTALRFKNGTTFEQWEGSTEEVLAGIEEESKKPVGKTEAKANGPKGGDDGFER